MATSNIEGVNQIGLGHVTLPTRIRNEYHQVQTMSGRTVHSKVGYRYFMKPHYVGS